MSGPACMATQYTLSLLPEGPDASLFAVTVAYRGDDRWAVCGPAGRTLNHDGEWEWEPSPSSRDDDYLTRCRFDLDQALRLAERVLPTVTVNGMTAADLLKVVA